MTTVLNLRRRWFQNAFYGILQTNCLRARGQPVHRRGAHPEEPGHIRPGVSDVLQSYLTKEPSGTTDAARLAAGSQLGARNSRLSHHNHREIIKFRGLASETDGLPNPLFGLADQAFRKLATAQNALIRNRVHPSAP
jgi:hypothetical protein